jgi:hypothetical protein
MARHDTKPKKWIEEGTPFLGLVKAVTANYFFEPMGWKECKKNANRWNADSSAPSYCSTVACMCPLDYALGPFGPTFAGSITLVVFLL